MNQCDKYIKNKKILKKSLLGNAGPSCLLWQPYQDAIADKVKAVSDIGQ